MSKSKRIAEQIFTDIKYRIQNEKPGIVQVNKNLIEYIEEYREYLNTTKSNSMAKRYSQMLNNFKSYIEEIGIIQVHQCKKSHIEGYINKRKNSKKMNYSKYLNEENKEFGSISAKTINEEVRTIRNLFKEAIERNYTRINPTENISRLKYAQKSPRFFSKEELKAILHYATPRMRTVYKFLANTGLRLGELQNLEWTDIDFENKILYIKVKDFWKPKNSKPRSIPLNYETFEAVMERKKT